MINAAIFLAEQWAKTEKVIYHSFSLPREEGIEYLISHYPVIQGMKNQMRLRRLSELACDPSAIVAEIDAVLPARLDVVNSGQKVSAEVPNAERSVAATANPS